MFLVMDKGQQWKITPIIKIVAQIGDTTVSLADNLISPLPPALNTTNSAATLVMSTCERSNSIAALAAVVTSGPGELDEAVGLARRRDLLLHGGERPRCLPWCSVCRRGF